MYGLIIWYFDVEDDPVRFSGLYETIDACFEEAKKCSKTHKIVQLIIEDARYS